MTSLQTHTETSSAKPLGIPPTLESVSKYIDGMNEQMRDIIDRSATEIAELREQNRELLEALNSLYWDIECSHVGEFPHEKLRAAARAIARAERRPL